MRTHKTITKINSNANCNADSGSWFETFVDKNHLLGCSNIFLEENHQTEGSDRNKMLIFMLQYSV